MFDPKSPEAAALKSDLRSDREQALARGGIPDAIGNKIDNNVSCLGMSLDIGEGSEVFMTTPPNQQQQQVEVASSVSVLLLEEQVSPEYDDIPVVGAQLAVSCQYLETIFLTEVEAAGFSRTTPMNELQEKVIRNKGRDAFCPEDRQEGISYVDCLDANDKDSVGDAEFVLSYAGSDAVGDIIDALIDFCICQAKDPKRTYVYIYSLCVNLHRIPMVDGVSAAPTPIKAEAAAAAAALEEEKPNKPEGESNSKASSKIPSLTPTQEKDTPALLEVLPENSEFLTTIPEKDSEIVLQQLIDVKSRLKSIGHLLVVMTPWADPAVLKRTWCIYEVYAALQMGSKIDIILPPSAKMNIEQNLLGGYDAANDLFKMLGTTKISRTHTTLDRDRAVILREIDPDYGGIGLPLFNVKVNAVFRKWFRTLADEFKALRESHSNLKNTATLSRHYIAYFEQTSLMFDKHDEGEAALEMMRRAMSIEATLTAASAPEKEDIVNPAKEALEAIAAKASAERKRSYHNVGIALATEGDLQGALQATAKDMVIQEAVFGLRHTSTATLYCRLGDLLQKQKENLDGAIVAYKRALDVYQELLGESHPATAATHINIGLLLQKTGKFQEAMGHFVKGQGLLGNGDPRWLVEPFEFQEQQLKQEGKVNAAIKEFHISRVISECILGNDDDPITAAINAATQAVQGKQMMKAGDMDGALLKYRRALEMYLAGLDTDVDSRVAILHNNIGAILQERKDRDGAMEELQSALIIYDKLDWNGSENTKEERATLHSNIGFMMKEKGEYKEALEEMQKALWFRIKLFGKDHMATANTVFMIASILEVQEDYMEAEEEYKKAYKVYKEELGKDSQRTMLVRKHIHIVKRKRKAIEKGLEADAIDEEEEIIEKPHFCQPCLNFLKELIS